MIAWRFVMAAAGTLWRMNLRDKGWDTTDH